MSKMLEVSDLTKHFGGLAAVRDVTCSVSTGEAVGIIGPNGAGKTTFFNLLSGFEKPSSGQVRFMGRSIAHEPPHIVSRLGLVRTFQTARPFPGLNLIENLMVGAFSSSVLEFGEDTRRARDKARAIASTIGLDAWINVPVEALPYGILKLMEIGKVLSCDARMLLLDEPFAGVSGREADMLAQVIQAQIDCGMTVVIIEHKLKMLMKLIKRVLVLEGGQLIADGVPEAIVTTPRVREAYLGKNWERALA